jgi:hypothetical protein
LNQARICLGFFGDFCLILGGSSRSSSVLHAIRIRTAVSLHYPTTGTAIAHNDAQWALHYSWCWSSCRRCQSRRQSRNDNADGLSACQFGKTFFNFFSTIFPVAGLEMLFGQMLNHQSPVSPGVLTDLDCSYLNSSSSSSSRHGAADRSTDRFQYGVRSSHYDFVHYFSGNFTA